MKYISQLPGPLLLILGFLLASTNGFSGNLPQLKQLNCGHHACLCKSGKAESPPHNQCWGWYDSHTYNLLELTGHPLKGAEISGFVTGGPSEMNSMVRGFKLQALPSPQERLDVGSGRTCRLLCTADGWRTLKTFAAPCAAGPKELITWEGHLPDIIALRIVAPDGRAVDNSKLWIEY